MEWLGLNDININVNMKHSEANGLFGEIQELKRKKANAEELIEQKTKQIIEHIIEHGNVLAYKNNEPYVLTVGYRHTNKFDKAQLASDTGSSETELNYVGVAELVEQKSVSAKALEDYYKLESTRTLKARKATKKDMELLLGRRGL